MSIDNDIQPNQNVKRPISRGDYQRHMLRERDKGNYFAFRRDYVTSRMLTRPEALFLQDIINHAVTREKKNKRTPHEVNGWFLCTTKFLEKSLLWDKDTQNKYLRNFKGKKFIETMTRGTPPKRYLRVDIYEIEHQLDVILGITSVNTEGVESAFTDVAEYAFTVTNNEKTTSSPANKKKNTVASQNSRASPARSDSRRSDTSSKSTPNKVQPDKVSKQSSEQTTTPTLAQQWARKLYEFLMSNNLILKKLTTLNKWISTIQELYILLDKDSERISKALDWYILNHKVQYVPKIRSAQSFKDKFLDLEDAIDRISMDAHRRQKESKNRNSVKGQW